MNHDLNVKCISILSVSKRPLEGYQFPVYTTNFCPTNKREWDERSSALNCSKDNGYMCIPNENFTELLEFCYVSPQILIEKGKYCLTIDIFISMQCPSKSQ